VEADAHESGEISERIPQLRQRREDGTERTPRAERSHVSVDGQNTQIRGHLFSPHTVNNGTNTYAIRVELTSGGYHHAPNRPTGLLLSASDGRPVSSFGDVPTTHQFFRFIEELKASGITSGCQLSPPLFCPDQALTRGQMAVFLSR
jgi:hypothetical protein